MRQTKERILKSLKQELAEKVDEKRSKKRMKVHRMVKFFGEGSNHSLILVFVAGGQVISISYSSLTFHFFFFFDHFCED